MGGQHDDTALREAHTLHPVADKTVLRMDGGCTHYAGCCGHGSHLFEWMYEVLGLKEKRKELKYEAAQIALHCSQAIVQLDTKGNWYKCHSQMCPTGNHTMGAMKCIRWMCPTGNQDNRQSSRDSCGSS